MKLRDNFAIFSTAMAGLSLELFIWAVLRLGLDPKLNHEKFMLFGQVFLLVSCALVYLAGRYFIKPLENILNGIREYGLGRFQHHIPSSKIKELNQLAQQLNQMADRLMELDNLKNEFVANISHELRSPLAAMEGYIPLLLLDPGATPQTRENLERMQVNLARLRHLVENLLELSRIESRQAQNRPECVDIKNLTLEVRELFSLRIAEHKLKLEVLIPEEASRAYADPAKVRQILINLLDNAIKYNSPGGGIRISAEAGANLLHLAFRDTGAGIRPEHINGLFRRFQRLPPASPELAQVKGAGLGLAISRSLARMMGGDIRFESESGAGSTFILSLPLRGS